MDFTSPIMKKVFYTLLFFAAARAAVAASGPDNKAVARIISFNAQGDTLSQGYGFFTSADGEVVTLYNTLKGAARAEVIDWKGKPHPALLIKGANSSQDLVRMQCEAKKMNFLPPAQVSAKQGDAVLQLYYSTNKKSIPDSASILSADAYESYSYYGVSTANESHFFGCPILNAAGEAVGIVQRNVNAKAESRSISIARDIPADETDAFSYLYMLNRMGGDSLQYVGASRLFAERFPNNIKGYTETANFYAAHLDYAKAEDALNAALRLKTNEDEVHGVLSDLIYQKALRNPEPAYKDWTLERALSESETAYALRPDTSYVLQQANCLFGLKRYREAHDRYLTAAAHSKAPAELYYYAANALQRAEGDTLEVTNLLTKAVDCFERPYTPEAAEYIFARAQHYDLTGQYRKAVQDYKDYELAIGTGNLTARFYDIRQNAEQRARQYQLAIDDLRTAASLATTTEEKGEYLTEIAFIYLRAGMYEEAIQEANVAKETVPNNPDVYKALGIVHGYLGHKADALSNLSRAQALGDADAQKFIEQFSK